MQQLDDYDKKLLKQLQQNNRMTSEELGALVNLSSSAVQRRLKRLREERIIEADVSIISGSVSRIGVTSLVSVILEVGNSAQIEKFKQSMRECLEVAQCYYVTGNYDFILLVNNRDMAHYETFSKKYLMDNPNVKHFHTHVVMDKVKVNYGVSL